MKDTLSIGRIVDIRDSIVSVSGIDAFSGELIHFKDKTGDVVGSVWNIEDDIIKVPLLGGSQASLSIGDEVYRTKRIVHMRCGFAVLGEILNPLGEFLADSSLSYGEFELARLFKTAWGNTHAYAPGIIKRAPVTIPLMTGVASIDSFIPVGCGQRELIIGDQNTGKTSLAITTIINQGYRNNDICGIWRENTWCNYPYSLFIPCIYVSIGSKRSEIVRLRKVLQNKNALHYTCIVFTGADDLAALQYLAPFSGCAIGEWFTHNGYNAVIVYDDSTQHAVAYRQLALPLRRPPGREAYPGDILFLHARLLERSAQLLKGGSLTAFPVITTQGGDLSGYISTNVISITDGQIFLVKSSINKGIRPAVDSSLSVSRVGSAAQYSAMVLVSKRIKGIFSTYRIYAGLAKIGGEDGDIMSHVNRGERLMAFFTQSLYETYSFYKQVVRLYALTIDSTDVILPSRISMFFTLFGLKQFNYIKNIEKRLVTFFMDTKTIEPLLIVSSSESILPEITLLINHFRNFFETDIQNNTSPEAASLISELVARTRAQENA